MQERLFSTIPHYGQLEFHLPFLIVKSFVIHEGSGNTTSDPPQATHVLLERFTQPSHYGQHELLPKPNLIFVASLFLVSILYIHQHAAGKAHPGSQPLPA